jgi:hypothetical protein
MGLLRTTQDLRQRFSEQLLLWKRVERRKLQKPRLEGHFAEGVVCDFSG